MFPVSDAPIIVGGIAALFVIWFFSWGLPMLGYARRTTVAQEQSAEIALLQATIQHGESVQAHNARVRLKEILEKEL